MSDLGDQLDLTDRAKADKVKKVVAFVEQNSRNYSSFEEMSKVSDSSKNGMVQDVQQITKKLEIVSALPEKDES